MVFSNSLEGRILKDHSGEERYQLGQLIGEGGFGHVYEAQDLKFDSHRRVAVKVVKPGFAKQIRREAILGQIEHPNVVRYLDYGTDGDLPYVVMEYLSGSSLDKIGRLSEERFHKFVHHVCSALQRAHEGNLVHRDLKPQNIMLVDEGRPEERFVILDFGIASQLDSSQSLRGATMDGAGTPEYMSPEQLQGKEPTQESDIYSFAVILYQQLTGRVPFPMETPSLPVFFELIMSNDPPRFRDAIDDGRLSSLAEDMEPVILRCLSKDPHARVDSVQEILETFEEISGQTGEGQQNLAQDDQEPEKIPSGEAIQNKPETKSDEQEHVFQKPPEPQIDRNEVSPIVPQTLKPERPKQHIARDQSDRPDASGPANGTLTPGFATYRPEKPESGTMFGSAHGVDQSNSHQQDSSENKMPSEYFQKPAEHRRTGFPIVKVSAVLVVSAILLFAGVLYPLIRRIRLENQLEHALDNSDYAQAARTVEDVDFLTQLWVNKDDWMQTIRESGNQKAREFTDDRNWIDAISECVLLSEVFTDDSESHQILKEIVETIEHKVEIDSDANRYRNAVESLNPNKNEVVKKLVEFDAKLISPELLTAKIRSQGLEKINLYLDRDQPHQAVRTGTDLQRAFRQDAEVNREVIRARIALHAANGSQFSKEKLFSKAVAEYTQALELASETSQKSSLTLERARITKAWAEGNERSNTKPDEILNRLGSVLEDLKSIVDQQTPISGALELQAETFLSRAEFHMKQADALDGDNQKLQKNDNVRAAIRDLHFASDGPLDEKLRDHPAKHLEDIATVYLTDGQASFNQALDFSNKEQNGLNANTDRKFQASIEAMSIAISAQKDQAAGYFLRAGARTHLSKPDYDGSLKDFQKFEQLAQEQLKTSGDSSSDQFELQISLARSYSLHAWVLATCSEEKLRDGQKALELSQRAEKQFDALEGKLPDADWLMARSDVFKSKSAAYAQLGDYEKAISATERMLADLTAPPTSKAENDYTFEEVEWRLHKLLLERYYKNKELPPFRFR